MVGFTHRVCYPRGKEPPPPGLVEQEAGRPAERVWTLRGLSREKTLDSAENLVVKYQEDKE
jgi:hypothetical protein